MKLIPDEKDHYNATAKNLKFYNLNISNFSQHTEWAITIMFYEIVHLIERVYSIAPLRRRDRHSSSHNHRYSTMQDLLKIPREITTKYILLKNLSQDARYEYDAISLEKLNQTRDDEYTELKDFFRQLYRKMRKRRK